MQPRREALMEAMAPSISREENEARGRMGCKR